MTLFRRARRFVSRARFIFGLGLLLSAGACSRHEPSADVTILNGAEPESLDPAIITGQPDSRVVLGLFEGLTRPDAKTARPIPGLAERWEISPDGKIYTFHLRTNLVWSTGEPIRADDVVYSWIRVLRPETASDYAGQLYYLKNGRGFNEGKIKDASLVGVHALDPFTIRVELEHPTAFFLDLCAFQTLNVVPRQTIGKYGDRWLMARPLPSSGPFELVYWRLNDKIRLKNKPEPELRGGLGGQGESHADLGGGRRGRRFGFGGRGGYFLLEGLDELGYLGGRYQKLDPLVIGQSGLVLPQVIVAIGPSREGRGVVGLKV